MLLVIGPFGRSLQCFMFMAGYHELLRRNPISWQELLERSWLSVASQKKLTVHAACRSCASAVMS
jgi:hypothetical protein